MTVENFDRRLAAGIRWSFLGLAFFLPLVLSTRSGEVFELPKMLFGYAAAAAIVGLWLSRMVLRREILIRRTPLDIPILLFLISQMGSTIYSIDPHVSWWGWYGRFHGGLVSTISYTLLYYAFVSNLSGTYEGLFSKTVKRYNSKTAVGKPVRQYTVLPSYRSTDNRSTVPPFHRLLIKAILFSALIVSAYAVLQHFGIDKDFWVQDVVNRVFSTQGQPNWLAAYLVMAIPLAFAMTISEIINHKSYGSSLRWNARYMIFYLLFLIYALALLWTKSRSGLLGLAAADLVFWSLVLFKSSSRVRSKATNRPARQSLALRAPAGGEIQRSDKNISIADARSLDSAPSGRSARDDAFHFLLIHLLLTILILATNNPAREYIIQKSQLISAKISSNQIMDKSDKSESEISDISIIRFLADFSRNSDFSGNELRKSEFGGTESEDIRRIVWNGSLQLVKQRPISGFGPETFGETYWRVRPKEHNLTSEWNFLYNKAHNEWLNLAANTGIFGLGAHLLLLGWFSAWSIKRSLLGVRQGDSLINTAILAAIVGVEVVNFFGFSTVTVGAYRYLFMAMAVVGISDIRNHKLYRQEKISSERVNMISYFLFMISSIVVLYLISQISIFFLADLAYNRGRAYQDAGYIEEAVEPLIRAVNLAPGEPVFRAELGEALSAVALKYQISNIKYRKQQDEDDKLLIQFRDEAIKNFEIVRKQSPYNLGFIRTQAKVMFLLGSCLVEQRDSSSRPGVGTKNDGSPQCEQALQLMKLAITMAPTNPQLPYSLGLMLAKMGQEEEAAVYFMKALELKPDLAEATEKL